MGAEQPAVSDEEDEDPPHEGPSFFHCERAESSCDGCSDEDVRSGRGEPLVYIVPMYVIGSLKPSRTMSPEGARVRVQFCRSCAMKLAIAILENEIG